MLTLKIVAAGPSIPHWRKWIFLRACAAVGLLDGWCFCCQAGEGRSARGRKGSWLMAHATTLTD